MKFYSGLGKRATQVFEVLGNIYGNSCVSSTQVFEYLRRCKDGRECSSDNEWPAQPEPTCSDELMQKVH